MSTAPVPQRPYGMHPDAWDAYCKAGLPPTRVGQTIGNAAASAGTHAKDGEVNGHDYCCATDFRISDLSESGAHFFCGQLAAAGFAPLYRKPGVNGWTGARHVHALWPGAPMKRSLRSQIHDYLHGKDGLVNEDTYTFRKPSKEECDRIRSAFLAHNPADN